MTEKVKSIAEIIKEEREKRKLSFVDLSKITKIPAKYLILLEKNKFDFLPAAIVKGFLKIISWKLKINQKELLGQFDQIFKKKERPPANLKQFNLINFKFKLNFFYYLIFVVILFYSGSKLTHYFYRAENKQFSQNDVLPKSIKPAEKVFTEPLAALKKKETEVKKDKNVELISSLIVAFDMKDKSWMRVIVDGKKGFEGILNKGSQPMWSANNRVFVRIGNAAAVYAYLNDKPLGVLGKEGEVVEKMFEKN